MTEAAFLRFATDAVPGRDPAAALRELNGRDVVFRLDALPGRTARAEILVHGCGDLRIMSASLAGLQHGAAGDADDELLFAAALAGTSRARQGDFETELADGEALLLRRGAGPFRLTHADRVAFLGVRVPRRAIAPFLPDLDAAIARRVPRTSGALRLLTGYLVAAAENRMLAAPAEARMVERHVQDLLALTFGAGGDVARAAATGGVRAARLQAIRDDVLAHLDDPDLSVAAVAARRRITPRYLHKLLESTGGTFSELVLGERLTRAYRMLVDPRCDDRSVSTVAFAVGFGDLSYFNRRFRRRFGATPSDVRRSR